MLGPVVIGKGILILALQRPSAQPSRTVLKPGAYKLRNAIPGPGSELT